VLRLPDSLSRAGAHTFEGLTLLSRGRFGQSHGESKRTGTGTAPASLDEGRLLVVCTAHSASTSLYFDRLPLRLRQRIRLTYSDRHRPEEMLGASAVVFVRELFEYSEWIDEARRRKIPQYYFLDDNFMALGRDDRYRDAFGTFTDERLRKALESFTGILLSSRSLLRYFRQRSLHGGLRYFPPIAGRERCPNGGRNAAGLRIGFFGGDHRLLPFVATVLPAIRDVAGESPTELVVVARQDAWEAARHEGAFAARGLTVHHLPYDLSLDVVLRRLAAQRLDVVVHPNSRNANNPYKTIHALLNAAELGAVPLVSDGPPFDQIRSRGVAWLCGDEPGEWARALRRVRDDPAGAAALRGRLSVFSRRYFGGSINARVLDEILGAPARSRGAAGWARKHSG